MKNIKTFITEAASDKDYPAEVAKYLFNKLEKFIDFSTEEDDETFHYYVYFGTSLTDKDVENLNKEFFKDHVMASHEYSYDKNKGKIVVNIFKQPQLNIIKSGDMYFVYFKNDLRSYYEKNKK